MRNLLLCTVLTLGCDAPDPELDLKDVETETEGDPEPESATEEPELDDESSGGELDPPDPQGGDAFHWPRRPTHPGPCDRPRPTLAVEP